MGRSLDVTGTILSKAAYRRLAGINWEYFLLEETRTGKRITVLIQSSKFFKQNFFPGEQVSISGKVQRVILSRQPSMVAINMVEHSDSECRKFGFLYFAKVLVPHEMTRIQPTHH